MCLLEIDRLQYYLFQLSYPTARYLNILRKTMYNKHFIKSTLLISSIGILTACGGGGAGTDASTSTTDGSANSTYATGSTTNSTSGNSATSSPISSNKNIVVQPTPVSEGTLFASPTGTGSGASADDPASLQEALNNLQGGDVLFLRGGVYTLSMSDLKKVVIPSRASGSSSKPTIIESYPGERAIIDGGNLRRDVYEQKNQGSLRVEADYVKVRRIEVRSMPEFGILVTADNVVVEGCESHHNGLTGIFGHHINNLLVQDNITHHNSDVGLGVNKWSYDNGDNADGIAVAYSNSSTIRHNIVYLNSDDGIDIWGSNNMLINANKTYRNGYLDNGSHAGKGNGNGIKSGGQNTHDNVVSYNLSWKNYSNGIDISESTNLRTKYVHNTTWHNGYNGSSNIYQLGRGYTFNPDTELRNNISSDDAVHFWNGNGIFVDNSWDRGNHSWQDVGTVPFINTTDPSSPDFLRPAPGSGYEDLGAYAGN